MSPEGLGQKPEDIQPKLEAKEKAPTVPETQQPVESTAVNEAEKARKEEARLAKIEELREQLGAVSPASEEEANTAKKESESKEDREKLSGSLRRISNAMDELSSAISRNKFPRVRFDSDQINALAMKETIDPTAISRELDNLLASIGKIKFPDDTRDWMALEPQNFRAVITQMEEFSARLSLLRKTLEEVKSQDLKNVAQGITKIRTRIASKVESFSEALTALRRIRERR